MRTDLPQDAGTGACLDDSDTAGIYLPAPIRAAYDKMMSREEYQQGVTDDAMVVETTTSSQGTPDRRFLPEYQGDNAVEDMDVAAAFFKIKKLIGLLTTLDFYVIVLIVFNCRRQQVPGYKVNTPAEGTDIVVYFYPLSCE